MEDEFAKIIPNKERASSILRMANTTLDMVRTIDAERFPSNVTKEYYEIIRELLGALLLLDGYKIYGESAHKRLIDYLKENYKEFTSREIFIIDNLRIVRNRISYEGFFVEKDYIKGKLPDIENIIKKLKKIIAEKLRPE